MTTIFPIPYTLYATVYGIVEAKLSEDASHFTSGPPICGMFLFLVLYAFPT
jgi:hypothetical protein